MSYSLGRGFFRLIMWWIVCITSSFFLLLFFLERKRENGGDSHRFKWRNSQVERSSLAFFFTYSIDQVVASALVMLAEDTLKSGI
jgi:hypothetical protein